MDAGLEEGLDEGLDARVVCGGCSSTTFGDTKVDQDCREPPEEGGEGRAAATTARGWSRGGAIRLAGSEGSVDMWL